MEKKQYTNKCPKCGASDIEYDIKKQKLVCNYCHTEFEEEKVEQEDLSILEGLTISEGSKAITNNNDLVIVKCDNCGAEVAINTEINTNTRCHWCHSILSIKSQIGNGSVPDLVLPFKFTKEAAKERINIFVKKRKFYANKSFKKSFNDENITGVYFPYYLIDCNAHAHFIGEGGRVINSYSKVVSKDKDGNERKETFYDIELSDVEREFDITIDDLQIESSKDKINKYNKEKTTNIINSIMPFDTENCVKYKPNYLIGYNCEKRDLNVFDIKNKIDKSLNDIIRHSINYDLEKYGSGVRWQEENIKYKGKHILSAFLPVWLYTYQEKNVLHYIAVNGRTGETMGSVPINKPRFALIITSIILLAALVFFLIMFLNNGKTIEGLVISIPIVFLFFAVTSIIIVVFCTVTLDNYRNKYAVHHYEKETKTNITNLKRTDKVKRILYEESFSFLSGSNNKRVEGDIINN